MKEFVSRASGFSAIPGTHKTLMERLEDALLPLINLVFLLLMFFIVAGQMQNRELPDLPGTAPEQGGDSAKADMIVLASGDWHVQGQKVDATNLFRFLPASGDSPSLAVGAAAGTAMSDLESLLSLLASEGYQDVVLLTEPAGK